MNKIEEGYWIVEWIDITSDYHQQRYRSVVRVEKENFGNGRAKVYTTVPHLKAVWFIEDFELHNKFIKRVDLWELNSTGRVSKWLRKLGVR